MCKYLLTSRCLSSVPVNGEVNPVKTKQPIQKLSKCNNWDTFRASSVASSCSWLVESGKTYQWQGQPQLPSTWIPCKHITDRRISFADCCHVSDTSIVASFRSDNLSFRYDKDDKGLICWWGRYLTLTIYVLYVIGYFVYVVSSDVTCIPSMV